MIQILSFLSPVGPLTIEGNPEAILSLTFRTAENNTPTSDLSAHLINCKEQLQAYFTGNLKQFNIPMNPRGTDFQRKVWQLLQEIPFGQTISYLELARRSGNRNLTRAVGAANGQNPIPILIPCHRVIGSNGSLTGFAGGLAVKKWLLEHERGLEARQLLFGF
ncbi:MAG: hypothetical protein A2X11_15250 [Bacteroidetes bacterium GWE2_42_24]|nr:MAG: hypothetical protein A2X11_15250 [Bacteroidetes bacterium GWE2_42_24]OFY31699.1 MAG: hypothetical protein A2X09_08995 [Bacteroidetes bacterium GWF2_43_11]